MKKIISIVLIVLMVCFLAIGSYATENGSSPDKAPEQNSSGGGNETPPDTPEERNFSGVIIIGLSLGLIVLMSFMQVRKERR